MKFVSYEPNRIRIFRCSCVKNFRESYVFHCLVIKVLCLSVSQTAYLYYHIHQCLSSTFLFSFRSFYDVCASLSGDLSTLSYPYWIVNNFFVFSKLFKLCVQKNQFFVTAQLEYHFLHRLSTVF